MTIMDSTDNMARTNDSSGKTLDVSIRDDKK